jgi:hypothetical protein
VDTRIRVGRALRKGFSPGTVSLKSIAAHELPRLTNHPSRWRQIADSYCDEALRETFPSPSSSTGVDLLECIERQASQGPGPARDFMDHVTSMPPEAVRASDAQILRGQAFFYTYSAPILAALMHFSLAGGFARFVFKNFLSICAELVSVLG